MLVISCFHASIVHFHATLTGDTFSIFVDKRPHLLHDSLQVSRMVCRSMLMIVDIKGHCLRPLLSPITKAVATKTAAVDQGGIPPCVDCGLVYQKKLISDLRREERRDTRHMS